MRIEDGNAANRMLLPVCEGRASPAFEAETIPVNIRMHEYVYNVHAHACMRNVCKSLFYFYICICVHLCASAALRPRADLCHLETCVFVYTMSNMHACAMSASYMYTCVYVCISSVEAERRHV